MRRFHYLFFKDIFFLIILIGLSLYAISHFINANYLEVGYSDWVAQAYRIKALDDFGFSSWVHTWSNGISLWRSYQFIPHFLTLGLANILHVEITRAMIIMTIILFVLLRINMYVVLRLLHFRSLTAFIGSILTFDIAQYWLGVSEFSLLFCFTLFPWMIYAWVKYNKGKIQYIYPYLSGVSFYVHPFLGITSFGLMAFSIVLSNRRVFSIQIVVQFFIFLLSSILFWYPLLFKLSYQYVNPHFSTKQFVTHTFEVFYYFGLSIYLLIAFGISILWLFKPLNKGFEWIRILLIFTLSYFFLLLFGYWLELPSFIYQLQYSRGIPLMGICIIIVFAIVIEKLLSQKALVIKGLVSFVLLLSFIEGLWFTSVYTPQPLKFMDDPVSNAYHQNKIDTSESRILSPHVHLSSYYGPTNIKLPNSYMEHLDSNHVAQRLKQLITIDPYVETIPESMIKRLEDYYKISGI